jgi:hypothetical protein
MDVSAIFKDLHGILDVSNLQPIRNSDIPVTVIIDAVNYLGVDEKDIYYDPSSMMNRYIYYNPPIFISLHDLKKEALEMLRMKDMIQQHVKKFADLKAKNDYEGIFRFMDKKILIPSFNKMVDEIPENEVYDIFIDLYVRSEYGFEQFKPDVVAKVFAKRTLSKDWTKRIKDLEKKVKEKDFWIYRGITPKSNKQNAMSWTKSLEKAKWFANRFGSSGTILKKKVNMADVLDYLTGRNEDEILIANGHNIK